MRLFLLRHGDAHAGFHGVIGGPRGCTGLTERGRGQAEALRDHLAASGRVRADVLLSSVIPGRSGRRRASPPAWGSRASAPASAWARWTSGLPTGWEGAGWAVGTGC